MARTKAPAAEQATKESTAADDKARAAEQAFSLVRMTRSASQYPKPHTADVHPAEVGNCLAAGWKIEE